MQNNAKQCKTMQNNAKQCKTMWRYFFKKNVTFKKKNQK